MEIPGFELIERLGQGGMATVWKARQLSLNRIVAIKILSERLALQQSDTERFISEAQSTAALKHPGIVQVYDANAIEGMYFFVMEHVAGYSVGDWLLRKEVISERDALITAEYVADALYYAWNEQRIIHCDIKPDNIMIDADGTVKVADLGLARSINSANAVEDEEEVMGTPNFMSPEQVTGEPDLDCRTDIYSLGAMLYQMVTGVMLFEGDEDGGSVMEKQAGDFVEDVLDLNPHLSMSICWLIEKMLARERDDRYSTWEEVLDDIARVKNGTMIAGDEPGAGLSVMRRSESRTRPVRKYHHISVEEEKRKIPLFVWILIACIVLGIGGAAMYLARNYAPVSVKRITKRQAQQDAADMAEEKARKVYKFAVNWSKDNPNKYNGAIDRFLTVAMDAKGTKYAFMAVERSKELKIEREKAITAIMAKLKKDTGPLIDGKEFDKAFLVYKNYRGQLREETGDDRRRQAKRIEGLKEKYVKSEDEKAAGEKYSVAVAKIAGEVLSGDLRSARHLTEQALESDRFEAQENELDSLRKLLRRTERVDRSILNSFRDQAGDTIEVRVLAGNLKIAIESVEDGVISGEVRNSRGNPALTEITLSELSPIEILGRIEGRGDPVMLRKGMAAASSGAFDRARKYFSDLAPHIYDVLNDELKRQESEYRENMAREDIESIVRSLGFAVGEYDPRAWVSNIERGSLTRATAGPARNRVRAFRRRYAGSQTAGEVEPVLKAIMVQSEGL